MGTEWVIPVLGLPFFGSLILLAVLDIRHRRVVPEPARTLGLGRGRIAQGYLGVMAASLCIASWLMWGQLQWGLSSGNYPRESASAYAVELFLFYFISLGTFTLVGLTVLGLPVLALLRRVRLLSALGLGLMAAIVCALLYWRGAPAAEAVLGCLLLAAGFSLAARLPLVRSAQVPANKTLEQP